MKNSKDIKKISEGLLGHLQRSLSFKNPQRFSDILKYLRNTNETILINELSFSANFIFYLWFQTKIFERTGAYQRVWNNCFFEKCGVLCFLGTLFLRFRPFVLLLMQQKTKFLRPRKLCSSLLISVSPLNWDSTFNFNFFQLPYLKFMPKSIGSPSSP